MQISDNEIINLGDAIINLNSITSLSLSLGYINNLLILRKIERCLSTFIENLNNVNNIHIDNILI